MDQTLKRLCVKSLLRNISSENIFQILYASEVYKLEELKIEGIEFLQNNFELVSQSLAWTELYQNNPTLVNQIIQKNCKKRKLN